MEPTSPFNYDRHQANLVVNAQLAAEEAALRANLKMRLGQAFVMSFSRGEMTPAELAEAAISTFERYVGDGITSGIGAVT